MEKISVTTYSGFSNVNGETNLEQELADIKSGKYARLIIKITSLVVQGKIEEANHVKKQLPFRTVTANYCDRRLPPGIIRYNPIITLDLDELLPEQLELTRTLINSDPHTLASFLSPKQRGYKFFVFLQTEYAQRLRAQLLQGEISYASLEDIHLKLYNAAKEHYEKLLKVEMDGSGKDMSRGYFVSFDPQAYFNSALQQEIEPLEVRILTAPPAKKKSKKLDTKGMQEEETEEDEADRKNNVRKSETDCMQEHKPEPWEDFIFSQAVTAVKRIMKFKEGSRDSFLFALGNKCYTKGLNQEVVIKLARERFGKDGFNVEAPLRNSYTYTDKTTEATTAKEEKKPVINQLLDFLGEHYGIRRNIILDRLERMTYQPAEEARKGYLPMRNKDYNSIFVDLQIAGIFCYQNYLKAVVDSNYAKKFNPISNYIDKLPPWDGTDYIGQLTETVQTEDQPLWREGFKRWIVGLVDCALNDEKMNQLVIILYSEQGKGKSSWIRHLLPPEWKEYFYNGMVNPENKDQARLLSTRIIINMEEFEGVKPGDLAALKAIIAQDYIIQRKVYDLEAFNLPRHCSFIGSTNNRQCLQDIGSNRRFLPISVEEIDYRTPVNHDGIYSQALALLKSGFRYWYEGEEITRLNKHNELHRMKDPVEENLFVYYRKPLPGDLSVKWLPASVILAKLNIYGKVQVNIQAQKILVQVLEKYRFRTRINAQDTIEYEVTDIQQDEVENNFKSNELP